MQTMRFVSLGQCAIVPLVVTIYCCCCSLTEAAFVQQHRHSSATDRRSAHIRNTNVNVLTASKRSIHNNNKPPYKSKSSSSSSKSSKIQQQKKTSSSATISQLQLPQQKLNRSSPPWHVLSPKDLAQNAKVRRDMEAKGARQEQLPDATTAKRQVRFTSEAERAFYAWKRFSYNDAATSAGMTLVGSFLHKQLPPRLGVPEVAFIGRSNVGKSSLLNALVSSKSSTHSTATTDWARVSKTPGATASLNMYALLGRRGARHSKSPSLSSSSTKSILLGFADLPGFGYAKLSKEVKLNIEVTAERYLDKRKELALIVLLVDARRLPSEDDRAVLDALYDQNDTPICVVATKVDKISSSSSSFDNTPNPQNQLLLDNLKAIQLGLDLPDGQPLMVSSVTGLGTKDLWRIIMDTCEAHVAEQKAKAEGGTAPVYDDDDDDDDGDDYDYDYNDEWKQEEGKDFVDDESFVYSQGYDWNPGNKENSKTASRIEFVNDDQDNNDSRQWEGDDSIIDTNNNNEDKPSNFKSLKKAVREKFRRGDV